MYVRLTVPRCGVVRLLCPQGRAEGPSNTKRFASTNRASLFLFCRFSTPHVQAHRTCKHARGRLSSSRLVGRDSDGLGVSSSSNVVLQIVDEGSA